MYCSVGQIYTLHVSNLHRWKQILQEILIFYYYRLEGRKHPLQGFAMTSDPTTWSVSTIKRKHSRSKKLGIERHTTGRMRKHDKFFRLKKMYDGR